MPYVTDEINNLIQGVSQQAPAARRPTQSARELNTMPSPVDGNGKRPPFELTGKLYDVSNLPFVHWINRDRVSSYAVTIDGDTLKVFDLADASEEASFDISSTHPLNASGGDLRKQYIAHTIADTTFIANRSTVVAAGSDTHPERPFEAAINVKDISFSQNIKIRVDGTLYFEFVVPDGSLTEHAPYTSTELIAEYAVEAPNVEVPGTNTDNGNMGPGLDTLGANFTVSREGSVIYISNDTNDFEVDIDDSNANRSISVVKGAVNRFSELPGDVPVDGFTMQIVGDDSNNYDDYYVKWDDTDKVWKECPEPGSRKGLDPATMPYILQRQADGSWTLTEGTWGERTAGSDFSNEDPPFVGKRISAISNNNGRLAIGAGEELYWSKALDVYDFYRETVRLYLEDDPFGVVCSGSGETVSEIRSIISFARRIITVSDSHQNIISRTGVFGKSGVETDPGPAIAVNPTAPALVLKSDLLLAADRGAYSGVTQMFIDNVSEVTEDEDVTAHVPKYIPKDLHTFTGSKTESMVFAASTEDDNALYVWTYLLRRRERPQSAWVRWVVDGEVVSAEAIGSNLFVVLEKDDAVWLLRANLSPSVTDPDQSFRTYLDWRVTEEECSLSYDNIKDETTVTLPYPWMDDFVIAIRGGDTDVAGESVEPLSTSAGEAVLDGDWTSDRKFYVGKTYSTEYEFSPIYVRNRDGVAIQSGRTQLTHILIDYENAGYFRVEVNPEGTRPKRTKTFEGRIMDTPTNKTDEVALPSGQLSVPVMGAGNKTTITIINDSFLPASFIKAEWKGQFFRKARPI